MATKTKETKRTIVEKTANKILGLATNANDLALNTTEKIFDTSFKMTHKSLEISSKVIKKAINIADTQQDLAFDVLNGVKKKIIKK